MKPHEKNWTRNLVTDDQTVLRTAKEAQNMEQMAAKKTAKIENESILPAEEVRIDDSDENEMKPVGVFTDGQRGYRLYMYETEEGDSVYSVKISHADGREENRKIDADAVDATNCDMVDLFVKMKHLVRNGSIDQETMNRELVLAHVYMQYRTPDANENTNINWVSWYEKQLELEMRSGNDKHIRELNRLLEML